MPTLLKLTALGVAAVLGIGRFHNHLVKSVPSAGDKVSSSPKEVRLWFNERPEVPFTSVTLLKGDSTKIVTIKAVATEDSMAVSAPLSSPLGPGSYLITWRTASRDGHAIRGTFGFTIAP
ncbi:MAG: copper resistance protein CopC [Gemmatimonadales bacterium]|nr:copper resistance protein CopC [Gemmatimonadales bacterium]